MRVIVTKNKGKLALRKTAPLRLKLQKGLPPHHGKNFTDLTNAEQAEVISYWMKLVERDQRKALRKKGH